MQRSTLRQGNSGDDGKVLRRALAENGLGLGALDGDYRQGTVTAVMAFRKSGGSLSRSRGGTARPAPARLLRLGRITVRDSRVERFQEAYRRGASLVPYSLGD